MSLTVTTGGNPSFSTARKKVGTKSLLLNSSNPDYLLIDSQHNALFSSLNDFTVEYWYYDDTYTINFPISSSGFEIESNFIVNDRLIVRINSTDVYKFSIGSSDWNPTVWQHFAFVRSNNTVAVYINGNIQTNLTSSTYSQSANLSDLVIGAKDFGQFGFQNGWGGNLDELRISNVARYTSNFTPTTSEFSVDSSTLLLMHMEDLSALAYNGPAENVVPYYTSTGTMSAYPPPKNVGGDFNSDLFWTADGDKANFPTLQGTLTCPNGLKFGDGTFQNSASTGSSLTVEAQTDGTQVTNVDTIIVTDGTLSQGATAGEAILNISGGAGGSISVSDGNNTVTGISTLQISNSTVTAVGGLGTVSGLAPLASPALTGTPTATTAGVNDNSTRIATTAWVKNSMNLSNVLAAGPDAGGYDISGVEQLTTNSLKVADKIQSTSSTSPIKFDLIASGQSVQIYKGSATSGNHLQLTKGLYSINIDVPTLSSSYTLTLPTTDGNANEVLQTDGAGGLSWVAQSGGGGGSSLTVSDGINTINSASTIEFPSGMLTTSSGSTATLQAPTLDQVLTSGASLTTFTSAIDLTGASTIIDKINVIPVTAGNTAAVSSTQQKFGANSIYLDYNNPDYIDIDSKYNSLFSSLADFTLEIFVFKSTIVPFPSI